jgi:lysozyme family protein
MSPEFLLALDRVFDAEGGFSSNPADPGGLTQFGITERTARKWGYTGNLRFLPKSEAARIYYSEYWLPIHGDDIPFPLAFQLFDFGVNSGPPTATVYLQRQLGLKPDGIFGPLTLAAARQLEGKTLLSACFSLLSSRRTLLASLPSWPSFSRGWTDRLFSNLSHLLHDCSIL